MWDRNKEFHSDFSQNCQNFIQIEPIMASVGVLESLTKVFFSNYDSSTQDVSFYGTKIWLSDPAVT